MLTSGDTDLGTSVIAVNPEGGKESRAHAASADCEAENVFLPEDAPWLSELLHVAAHFPTVKHDDCIDAMTQYLNWRRKEIYRPTLLEYYERQQAKASLQRSYDSHNHFVHAEAKWSVGQRWRTILPNT
jgi:hypothetical protein